MFDNTLSDPPDLCTTPDCYAPAYAIMQNERNEAVPACYACAGVEEPDPEPARHEEWAAILLGGVRQGSL